jgi:cell division cycle 2-like
LLLADRVLSRRQVKLREVVVGGDAKSFYLVMEFLEHDLRDLMDEMKIPFVSSEIKRLMLQLLSGVAHLHDNWIVHRYAPDVRWSVLVLWRMESDGWCPGRYRSDLKTSNLLLNNKGVLKIADFGLARHYGSPLKVPFFFGCTPLLRVSYGTDGCDGGGSCRSTRTWW